MVLLKFHVKSAICLICQLNMYAEIIRLTLEFQQIKVPPVTFQIPFQETKAKACPTLGF